MSDFVCITKLFRGGSCQRVFTSLERSIAGPTAAEDWFEGEISGKAEGNKT